MRRYKTHSIFAKGMNNKCIKVGIVNYRNTFPLLVGLEQMQNIQLIKNYPAAVAQQLLNDTIDIGLVPIAIMPNINKANIIGNYCIASNKVVASVCLFSDVPLEKMDTILLDYQSKTSIQLVQILCREFWKINITFKPADLNYISEIKNNTAGVIIGDRAFEQANQFAYCYDLAEAWQAFTSLPFVFAAWISKHHFSEQFINEFNAANKLGLHDFRSIVAQQHYTHYDLYKYYTENISYELDDTKRKSIALFLQKMKQNQTY
jgi:chorismate dehydratase